MRNGIHCRWMIHQDLAQVAALAAAATKQEVRKEAEEKAARWLTRLLRRRDCICIVLEEACSITGYALYQMRKSSFRVVQLRIRPDCRRQGRGTALLHRLQNKARDSGRNYLEVRVSERDLEQQLFLRSLHYRAIRILRGRNAETGCDTLVFHHRLLES